MRTILYQPVYINPQAYFVFPSLYHIEKGDSYVEPAVYTGQLLIDVVDGSASSVIIKDTKQVDFSDYAGKHIRISQYTDEGAVVLGEWELPANTNTIEKQEETEDNTIELINYDKTRKS